MDRIQELFELVAVNGQTNLTRIRARIAASGIHANDRRLRVMMGRLAELGDAPIDLSEFTAIVGDELLMINRAFYRQLIIPDWEEFCADIQTVYDRVAPDRSGTNAGYIPVLRDADPEKWGVSICTVDGQRLSLGDVGVYHSIQSVSKPITYAAALVREGVDFTHSFVGAEPSGRAFNALELLPDMRPFNPCVNSGAIMTCGIVASGSPDKSAREITQGIMDFWSALSGGVAPVRFSESTMVSERETAHNNFAIAYLLRGKKGLPREVDLHKMLDLYFSCCSIEMTCEMLSIAAATLANGGVCPITGEEVVPTEVVKKTLAVMQTAGMYDNAGAFTLEVGLPGKSGVAGAVLVVVPNVMGFATFSPRLDATGNSVRGVSFCRNLVDRFTFHVYDSLSGGHTGCKRDPRASQNTRKQRDLTDMRWAASYGDRYASRVRDLMLECMVDVALADGEVADAEIEMMAEAYADIMGARPDMAGLRATAAARQREGVTVDRLVGRLAEQRPQLDDNGRELILEAAFRVACADGKVEDEERRILLALAGALGVNEGVLEMEIARFQRQIIRRSMLPPKAS